MISNLILYHGTPLKINAIDIIKRGLDPKGEIYIGITPTGGKGISITHKEYLTKDVWVAAKQAFTQPKSFSVSWDEFVDHEPYGYIFMFETDDDKVTIEKGMHTISENMKPTKVYKIKKPKAKFLESIDEYTSYFKKYAIPVPINPI